MNIELFCNGKTIPDAQWNDVKDILHEIKEEGYLCLTILPRPETGPKELEIQFENGNYRPILVNVDGTGYRFSDPAARGKEMVPIGGYDYDPMGVTRDYELIVRMIREFYHTGNVSPKLWSPQSGTNP